MVKYKIEELDFLFIYEHKVRELENLCLLKYELDRRGYRVKIVHIEDAEALKAMRPIYHTKVVEPWRVIRTALSSGIRKILSNLIS